MASLPEGAAFDVATVERRVRERLAEQPDSAELQAALFDVLARAGRFGEAAEAYSTAHSLDSARYPAKTFLVEPPAPCLVRQGDLARVSYAQSPQSFDNAKILIVGLPKTGTVWLHQLIADCLDLPILNPFEANRLADFHLPGVVKTHSMPDDAVAARPDLLHAVYIMRDIRDVVVSLYYYTKTDDYRRDTDASVAAFADIEPFYYEAFLSYYVPHHIWLDHPERWVRAGLPLVWYERLWDDPCRELRRVLARWGLASRSGDLSAVVERNSIERMKRTKGLTSAGVSAAHYRKGGYGGFREELPGRVLRDMNDRFGSFLHRWGYDV